MHSPGQILNVSKKCKHKKLQANYSLAASPWCLTKPATLSLPHEMKHYLMLTLLSIMSRYILSYISYRKRHTFSKHSNDVLSKSLIEDVSHYRLKNLQCRYLFSGIQYIYIPPLNCLHVCVTTMTFVSLWLSTITANKGLTPNRQFRTGGPIDNYYLHISEQNWKICDTHFEFGLSANSFGLVCTIRFQIHVF